MPTSTGCTARFPRAPYRANRVAAMLSKMLSFAVKLEWREENPVRGLDRNPEERRYRYLAYDELRRLTEALPNHSSRDAANAVQLLLLTGARPPRAVGQAVETVVTKVTKEW